MYHEYSQINKESDEETRSLKQAKFLRSPVSFLILLNVVLFSAVIFLSFTLSRTLSPTACVKKWSTYSPLLPLINPEPKTVKFNGTFAHSSPYKGPPSAEVDKAWDDLYTYGSFNISPADLKRIDGRPIAAQWPPEAGGEYIGFLEVLHHIHCVHFLWQHVYEDYYSTRGGSFLDPKPVRLEHANHCADLLRQKLMCDADVGLIPMYWVKNHDHPWPDFNTVHQCRNFDDILDWVKENQVVMPEGISVVRTEDVVDLEVPP